MTWFSIKIDARFFQTWLGPSTFNHLSGYISQRAMCPHPDCHNAIRTRIYRVDKSSHLNFSICDFDPSSFISGIKFHLFRLCFSLSIISSCIGWHLFSLSLMKRGHHKTQKRQLIQKTCGTLKFRVWIITMSDCGPRNVSISCCFIPSSLLSPSSSCCTSPPAFTLMVIHVDLYNSRCSCHFFMTEFAFMMGWWYTDMRLLMTIT